MAVGPSDRGGEAVSSVMGGIKILESAGGGGDKRDKILFPTLLAAKILPI